MYLEQNKLDVTQKQRSNCFNWKGQFTPEFIEYLIDCYSNENSTVVDPFSGSGTVLSEAIRRGLPCTGFEVNPSAYYMSKFYEYAMLSDDERRFLYSNLKTAIGQSVFNIPSNLLVYEDNIDYRLSYANLLNFAKFIAQTLDPKLIPFMINVLFLCEKGKKMSLRDALIKNIIYIRDLFFDLPYTQKKVTACLSDARNIATEYNNAIDLVITSPPYINVFNYHQNYRGIIECFGYNVLKVAESEIGSNRKHRSNRFKTVVQYAIDMGNTILNTSFAMKQGGKMVFVVGRESMVRKTPFYNSRIIEDIVNVIPSLYIESINERQFGNRYGACIKEDIFTIIKNKPDIAINTAVFKQIGLKHIEKALSYASNDLESDLLAILSNKEIINESPIYA